MSVKQGRIVEIEPPPGGDWCRVTLHTGQRVYVHKGMVEQMPADLAPDTWLVFVERGPLGQTVWMGERHGVADGVQSGVVTPAEAVEAGMRPDGSPPSIAELEAQVDDMIKRGLI